MAGYRGEPAAGTSGQRRRGKDRPTSEQLLL